MKNRVKIFQYNKLVGGYSLAVRDNWSYKIKRIHISDYEYEEYLKTFGNEIVTLDVFYQWWNNLQKNTNK